MSVFLYDESAMGMTLRGRQSGQICYAACHGVEAISAPRLLDYPNLMYAALAVDACLALVSELDAIAERKTAK
eukprot:scaffold3137_cov18-Tisochrysis_lutea.AAC.1